MHVVGVDEVIWHSRDFGLCWIKRHWNKDIWNETSTINDDNTELPQKYTLHNVVGAWTAAINACGKASRMELAVKLIYAMPNFGVFLSQYRHLRWLLDGLFASKWKNG